MLWTIGAILFLFGAVVGSFLNVVIYRLPIGKSVVFPASHCPACKQPIAWHDNVPILGWLLLRGRCRRCHAPISMQYPIVEFLAGIIPLLVVARFGLGWESLALTVLGWAFLVLTIIDLHHYILPDLITLPGIAVGLGLAALPQLGPPLPGLESALIGAAVGGGGLWLFAWLFYQITGKHGMGFGDVKLFGMIGAWLGWPALPFTLFAAALMGSVVGLGWILILGRDRHLPIPFGPYLVVGAWLFVFYGPQAYDWYLSMMLRPGG